MIDVEQLKRGGIIKLKGKDIFSVWIKTRCSNLTSKQLERLASLAEKYGRGFLLFTTRQIPIMPFIHLKDVEEVKRELSEAYIELDRCGPRVRNINVCYGSHICPEAVINPISLAEKLDNYFYDSILHKIKIGVAGCRKDCPISRVLTDIGFIGVQTNGTKGYDVYAGGRLGLNPFVGMRMAECLSEQESTNLVQNYFDLLRKWGKEGERSADLINRLGFEIVKKELNKNLKRRLNLKSIQCDTGSKEQLTDKQILRIRATCGEVSSRQLRKIAEISEKYGRGFVHFAVRGAPEIPGLDLKDREAIRKQLNEVNLQILDKGIDNLQSCYGDYCTESLGDPQSLLRKIEKKAEEIGLNNLNIKISAGGCPNSCAISYLNDIGFHGVVEPEVDGISCTGCGLCVSVCKRQAIKIKANLAVIDEERCRHCGQCIAVCPVNCIKEKRKGFAVLAGGREGEDLRLGRVIAEYVSEEECVWITERCLRILKEKDVDAATIIDEVGIDKFKEMLIPTDTKRKRNRHGDKGGQDEEQ